MKKIARLILFSIFVSTFIFGCTTDEENNDSKSPTEQNENANRENPSNKNTGNTERDNSNATTEETNTTQNQERTNSESENQEDNNDTQKGVTEENPSDSESKNNDLHSENETPENTEKTDDKNGTSENTEKTDHENENPVDDNQSNSSDEKQNLEEIYDDTQNSNSDEVKDNSDSENKEESSSGDDKNNEEQGETGNESENKKDNNDTQKDESSESESKQEIVDEEQYVIKLYASEIQATVFKMTASKTYTLELFEEWSRNDMATLASKLREVSADCNIIFDDSKAIITSGMEFLYDIPNLARKIGERYFRNFSTSSNLSDIKFRKLVIADDVTEIPKYTFYTESFRTPYLESITIPASVKSIGREAFFGCSKLKEVIIEDSDEPMKLSFNKDGGPNLYGQGLFYDCPLEKVYVGRNLIYKNEGRYGFSPFSPRRTSTNMEMKVRESVTNY